MPIYPASGGSPPDEITIDTNAAGELQVDLTNITDGTSITVSGHVMSAGERAGAQSTVSTSDQTYTKDAYFKSSSQFTTVTLTSGTSWTVPGTANNIIAVITGGGAGGSSSSSNTGYAGGGGGAGQSVIESMSVSPGASVSYTIGSGGSAGSAGGTTTFNSVSASGGSAATNSSGSSSGGGMSAGVNGSSFGGGGGGNAGGSGVNGSAGGNQSINSTTYTGGA